MRKNIVAGNWKMNKTLQEGIALAKELNEALANEKPNCDVIICTPFIHLASVTPLVDAAKIGVGAENCADKGIRCIYRRSFCCYGCFYRCKICNFRSLRTSCLLR